MRWHRRLVAAFAASGPMEIIEAISTLVISGHLSVRYDQIHAHAAPPARFLWV